MILLAQFGGPAIRRDWSSATIFLAAALLLCLALLECAFLWRYLPRELKFRRMPIACSVACGFVCLVLTALWMRSYWWQDVVSWRYLTPHAIRIYTYPGRFSTEAFEDAPRRSIYFGMGASVPRWDSPLSVTSRELTEPTAWHLYAGPIGNPVLIPFCAPVMGITSLAVLPWVRWRFSLRTLLIAMTLLAIGFGAIVYLAH